MKTLLFRAFLLAFLAVAAVPAWGQQTMGIVAVVNDDIITAYDLNTRIELAVVSSQLEDSQEVRRRLAPQILRTLIDEKLRLQEAERLGITVAEEEIETALRDVAARNNIPPGGMDTYLAQQGLEKETLVQQVRASIAWVKVIRRRAGGQVDVSDEAIDSMLERLEAEKGTPEYLLREIFLASDGADPQVEEFAGRLIQELGRGAPLPALAQQFSQSPTAAAGGEMGWVRASQLPEEVAQTVERMVPGQLAGPIRSPNGYYIIFLQDRRRAGAGILGEEKVSLHQIFLPLSPEASDSQVEAMLAKARDLTAGARSCKDMESVGESLGSGMSGSLGTVKVSAMPAPLRSTVQTLDEGKPSEPKRMSDGIAVFMVCDRQAPDGASEAAKRQRVHDMLLDQRLDLLSQRLLRDLKRAAFIDIRL